MATAAQPHASPVKILVVDDNEKARDGLIELLRFEDVQVVGESTLGAAAYTWAEHLDVDVVLVTVGEPLARALRTVESLSVGTRTWPVIALSPLGDRDTMRKAMLAGARDYVVTPATGEELRRTVREVRTIEQTRRTAASRGEAANRLGTIVAVFGVKGGIGKSTIATNVAVTLAQQTKQHVAMLDLDLQFGDDAVLLDLLPQRTIADAARDVDRMDPQLITGYLTDHASRLRLLAAPPRPEDADHITPDAVGQILEAMAATNDYVVVDTKAEFDSVTMVALDLATIILVPVLPEVTCVRRTKAALSLMQQWGYTRDKVKLVVNRNRRRPEVSLAELEEVLAYPIYAKVPDDSAIQKAISLGTPVAMSGPKTKSGRAILELGRQLAGLPEPPPRSFFGLRWRTESPSPLARPAAASGAGALPAPQPAANGSSLAAWAGATSQAGPTPPTASSANGHAPGETAPVRDIHSDPFAALDQDYWDALLGPREAKTRIWANLIGPSLSIQDGPPAGERPLSPWPSGAAGAVPAPTAPARPTHPTTVPAPTPALLSPNGAAD